MKDVFQTQTTLMNWSTRHHLPTTKRIARHDQYSPRTGAWVELKKTIWAQESKIWLLGTHLENMIGFHVLEKQQEQCGRCLDDDFLRVPHKERMTPCTPRTKHRLRHRANALSWLTHAMKDCTITKHTHLTQTGKIFGLEIPAPIFPAWF